MIEDLELRQLLTEEAKVIRKEYERLGVEESVEAFRQRQKLKNRYEEIERLLGAYKANHDVLQKSQRRHWLATLAIAVVVAAAFIAVAWEFWQLNQRLRIQDESIRSLVQRMGGQDPSD